MLLSVIIPVYNNSFTLNECIASFGTADDVEFVVVDDGSDNFIAPTADNVKVVRCPHRGAAMARNSGVEIASGRYVWFFDADDKVRTDVFVDLLKILKSLPDDADLMHTGAMVELSPKSSDLPQTKVDCSSTRRINSSELFVPQTAYLDHTTYIVSRCLMLENPSLRYPDHSILEDALFVLLLLQKASNIYVNDTISPYIRHSNRHSSTSGMWSEDRCSVFVPDICAFFKSFADFLQSHGDITRGSDCYQRLRYVYLRVLTVKGCPWPQMRCYREAVLSPTLRGSGLSKAYSIVEWLLYKEPLCRTLSFACRKLRRRNCD